MQIRHAMLCELAVYTNCQLITNDDSVIINGLNFCDRDSIHDSILSFVVSANYLEHVLANKAIKCLFITKELYELFVNNNLQINCKSFFLTNKPEIEFYKLHERLWNDTDFYDHYSFQSIIGLSCKIHPSAVIEDGVIIGNGVTIGPNSVIRSGTIIDDDVYIGCCSVIGSEGFQVIKGMSRPITHVGVTHLCNNVYVGDCTTIGNGLFEGETIIEKATWISNHVLVAHNCKIGENCVLTGSVMLMGSSTLEDNVWMAPQSITLNKVKVRKNAFVGTMSFANKDVEENIIVAGIPAREIKKRII